VLTGDKTTDDEVIHSYRVGPLRRWLLWFIFGPVVLGLLVMGLLATGEGAIAFSITGALAFLIALPFQWIIDRTRLELSSSKIRLRHFGFLLETEWENVATMRLDRGREGFITKSPLTGKGADRLARFRGPGAGAAQMYDPEERELLAERRLIPIAPFAWHLRHGRLRQDIARFAPELVQPTKNTK
jgi:hypothetical protein